MTRRPAERMAAALMSHDLPHRTRVILALLALRDGPGGCWPSLDRLSRESGVDKRELRKVLNELRGRGLISWRRTGKANVYTIHYSEFGTVIASAGISRTLNAGNPRTEQEEKGILRGLGRDGAEADSSPSRGTSGHRRSPMLGGLIDRVGPVPQIPKGEDDDGR